MASRAGTATSGVPAKTSLIGRSGPPCGLTLTTGGAAVSYQAADRIAFIASLRASGSSRSTNRIPSRWSVSCCTQRAIRPVPTSCAGSPYSFQPLATTFWRRLVSKCRPGMDRQPSGPSCSSPSGKCSTGLIR